MTREEFSHELYLKPSYVAKHWYRIKEIYPKKGIDVIKIGRGDSVNYGIKLFGEEDFRFETTGEVIDFEKVLYNKEWAEWLAAHPDKEWVY